MCCDIIQRRRGGRGHLIGCVGSLLAIFCSMGICSHLKWRLQSNPEERRVKAADPASEFTAASSRHQQERYHHPDKCSFVWVCFLNSKHLHENFLSLKTVQLQSSAVTVHDLCPDLLSSRRRQPSMQSSPGWWHQWWGWPLAYGPAGERKDTRGHSHITQPDPTRRRIIGFMTIHSIWGVEAGLL